MKYMLSIIGNKEIVITKEQKEKIVQAMDAGATRLDINGSVVFLHSVQSIMPADEYIASRNRHLNQTGKWMCKHGKVIDEGGRCDCSYGERLTDTHGLITGVEKVECPQCHSLSAHSDICDSCDAALALPPPALD